MPLYQVPVLLNIPVAGLFNCSEFFVNFHENRFKVISSHPVDIPQEIAMKHHTGKETVFIYQLVNKNVSIKPPVVMIRVLNCTLTTVLRCTVYIKSLCQK